MSLLDPLHGIISKVTGSVADLGLDAVGSWVLHGTEAALEQVAQLIGQATAPQLESDWFSNTYLQVAEIASLLTLPFLFAAAIQAVLRGDLMLLARSAFMYLPIALLGVSLAAPMVMLLLAATDEMCAIVAGAGIGGGAAFLDKAAAVAAGTSALNGSPFLAFMTGLIALAAALALMLELMIRAAAVYIVVLMLPLAFAALVWPARRIWAIRVVELLVSLILSKFVIVAVLSLAGAAFGAGSPDTLLTAMALLLLATFAPWALMRLLPFTEVAAAAGGTLRAEVPSPLEPFRAAGTLVGGAGDVVSSLAQGLRRDTDTGRDDPGVYDWDAGHWPAADGEDDPLEATASGSIAGAPLDESRQIGPGDTGYPGDTGGGGAPSGGGGRGRDDGSGVDEPGDGEPSGGGGGEPSGGSSLNNRGGGEPSGGSSLNNRGSGEPSGGGSLDDRGVSGAGTPGGGRSGSAQGGGDRAATGAAGGRAEVTVTPASASATGPLAPTATAMPGDVAPRAEGETGTAESFAPPPREPAPVAGATPPGARMAVADVEPASGAAATPDAHAASASGAEVTQVAEAGPTQVAEAGPTPVAEAEPTPEAEAGPTPVAEAGPTPVAEATPLTEPGPELGAGAGPTPPAPTDFGDLDPEHAERLSDFGPAWHARNGSWHPMRLGPDGLAEGRVFSIDPPATEAAAEPEPPLELEPRPQPQLDAEPQRERES